MLNETMVNLVKLSFAFFIAGNLLDTGLRLDLDDALTGLRNARFVALTLVWGFVFCPVLAYAITLVIPLDPPYATGLILLGTAPCAPFLPAIVRNTDADLGYTAALMLLAAVGTVAFMPLAVPFMVTGLTVSAWTIAKPLLAVVLLPLVAGVAINRRSAQRAASLLPAVRKATQIATIAMVIATFATYGRELFSVGSGMTVLSQVTFFAIVATLAHWSGFRLPSEQKIVLTTGMATRNIGSALAPLLSIAAADQRALSMVMMGFPMMVISGLLSARCFGQPAVAAGQGTGSAQQERFGR